MTDWTERWLYRAQQLALWSKDPSTKVGCILVKDQHAVGEGYNGFPHGVEDNDARLLDRVQKYDWTIHAEANAVAHAARYGHNTSGTLAFVTFPPCPTCTTLLIQAGVVGLVVRVPVCPVFTAETAKIPLLTELNHRSCPCAEVPFRHHHVDMPWGVDAIPCPAVPAEWRDRWAVSQAILQEAGVPVTVCA